ACEFGVTTSDTTVVLFGDSHSAQWFPALEVIAKERGWRLVSLTKSACPSVDVTVTNSELKRVYTECDTWRAAVIKRINELKPTAVIMASYPNYEIASGGNRVELPADSAAVTAWQAGLTKSAQSIAGSGARVIVLQDTPHAGFNVPDCLVKYIDRPERCSFDTAKAINSAVVVAEQNALIPVANARYLSMNDAICGSPRCPSMKDGMIRYEDDSHVAVKYIESLAPELSRRLTGALH
ncbi:MAG TPA: SGNH hydrolase domain-containing protein, partial [Gemmatimonadaceae bacterium]